MRRTLFKSKIHRATVTQADLDYEGSVTIDAALMSAADILPYEKVLPLAATFQWFDGTQVVAFGVLRGLGGSRSERGGVCAACGVVTS